VATDLEDLEKSGNPKRVREKLGTLKVVVVKEFDQGKVGNLKVVRDKLGICSCLVCATASSVMNTSVSAGFQGAYLTIRP